MSKKHLNPLEDPPTASSSDDDEVETSEGEDSSSEEEEAPSSVAVTIAVPGKSSAVSADSDSGSETETESDSETERASIPPPNQGSGKSVAVVTTTTTTNTKKKEPTLALPAVKSGTKRPSEGTSRDTNAKRTKKATSGGDEDKKMGGEDTKKPAFQRLWSEEDEIAVLQGMIDFKGDTGKSPYEDTNGFYEFIKKSISFEVSKNQFMDKIRSLKKKYIMGKDKNGVELIFTKPHDLKCSALSKFIWGPEGLVLDSAVKSNGVSKKSQSKTSKKLDSVKQELVFGSPNGKEEDKNVVVIHGGDLEVQKEESWFENSFLVRAIAGFGIDEYSVKQRWSLVPEESKKKIEEKLKALQAKEIDFVLMKSEFLHEVTSMIAEATKN